MSVARRFSVIVVGMVILIYSCKDEPQEEFHPHFPDIPTNFEVVNSEYDDFNSNMQYLPLGWLLQFSSNRNSQGQHYDIVSERVRLRFHMVTGIFTIETDTSVSMWHNFELMIDSVNSLHDEFGPCSYHFNRDLLFYSSDVNGAQDIYFIYSDEGTNLSSPQMLGIIDMNANELYPSFFGNDFYLYGSSDQNRIRSMIYCSDKDGQFDIYNVEFTQVSDIISTLSSNEIHESQKLNINSANDDKCPYVNGYLMVFASNRLGGFGGYDLYYSRYEYGNWSEPTNFGDIINTEYDEYRPITISIWGFDNNLMIFSSNRVGGKGGFDLYYVGIESMIE